MADSYFEQVKDDIKRFLEEEADTRYDLQETAENDDWEKFEDQLLEDLWVEDSVTGNASGSYFFNSNRAKEQVLGEIETVVEAYREFDSDIGEDLMEENGEKMDVTARCYILGSAVSEALEEFKEEHEEEYDTPEE